MHNLTMYLLSFAISVDITKNVLKVLFRVGEGRKHQLGVIPPSVSIPAHGQPDHNLALVGLTLGL